MEEAAAQGHGMVRAGPELEARFLQVLPTPSCPVLPSCSLGGAACEVLPSLRPGLHSSPIPKEQTGPPSGLGTGCRPLRERSSRTPERVPAEPSGSVPCLPIPGPRKVLSLSRCSPQVLRPLGQNRAGPVNPWPRCFSLLPMSSCLKGRGCWM